jgi:hypothetical protein
MHPLFILMYLNSELAITYNEMLCWFEVENFFLHGVMTRALLECIAWALLLVSLSSMYTGPLPPPSLKKRVLHQVSCGDGVN